MKQSIKPIKKNKEQRIRATTQLYKLQIDNYMGNNYENTNNFIET